MKIPKIRRLPSGAWFCQLRVGGQSISITHNDYDTVEAQAYAYKSGLMKAKKKPAALTLNDAILSYEKSHENVLSPSTIRGYEIIRKNRFARLMCRRLSDIDRRAVQAAVNEEAACINHARGNQSKPVSAKTLANAYGLVRSVLAEYDIDVSRVKLPQKIKTKKKYLEAEEIARLIDAAVGDACEIPIVMAAWLGLRRSEIAGLKWDSIDFDKGTITIENTMVPDKENKMVVKAGAKNESSQRTISCPEYILSKLRKLERRGEMVFHVHPDTIRKHVHRLCAENGLPDCHVHGLRHANAAVMTSLNITDRCAMARGGWSSEYTFKQIYAYLFDKDAKAADDAINEFFHARLAALSDGKSAGEK